jgi:acetyl esterase/lipase
MKKLLSLGLCLVTSAVFAAPSAPIRLWPGQAPGETREFPAESDTTKPTDRLVNGVPIVRLGNVTQPTITVYRPDPAKDTGAAVIVAPGGGYNILAWELEGTEICEWLNSIGVTGVLLKYRVPSRPDRPRHAAALDDAQRALGLVRHQAKALGIDPQRIGMLGFSAGAHLSAALAANHATRTYPAVDAADAVSCRPDFLVLVYPGGVVDRDKSDVLRPEVVPVKGDAPPAIIVMTQDDPVRVENALVYYTALKQAEVPAEMHLYPTGGHGYGLRRNEHLVTTWPDRVTDWLKVGGWLRRAP